MIRIFKNLLNVFKALKYIKLECYGDSSIKITHELSGSYVQLRSDGNIDIYASRNVTQDAKGLILHSSPNLDKFSSTEEVKEVHPEWFKSPEDITHAHSCTESIKAPQQHCFTAAWVCEEYGFKNFLGKDTDPKRRITHNEPGFAAGFPSV